MTNMSRYYTLQRMVNVSYSERTNRKFDTVEICVGDTETGVGQNFNTRNRQTLYRF